MMSRFGDAGFADAILSVTSCADVRTGSIGPASDSGVAVTTIPNPEAGCTVIVTVDGPAAVLDQMVGHAQAGLHLFGGFDAFVSGALHRSEDRRRLVQYVQWTTREGYEAAVDDPSWGELESTERFTALVRSGEATVDARVFEILGATENDT